jgi:DNA-binding NtrC family response regulator
MGKILLVDDEPSLLFTLQEVLNESGHLTVSAASAADGLSLLEGVDAVLTDLQMPTMDGLSFLRAIRERDPTLPVIVLTAHGSEKLAVHAMKAGAFEYLTKPFDIDEVTLVVERALNLRELRQQNRRLVAERALGRRLIVNSTVMSRLLESVERIASRNVTVLIQGETGTGKELIASLLHEQSGRAKGPFVRFNCAAVAADLAESELFGHAKGAFTGAHGAHRGYFAEAHGGTLVLDEVGELPFGVQAKLLRALQDGEIQPVGAARPERVDVRIVASTNRDLRADAKAGRFREDLYYRLAVVELLVAPLRDRRSEIRPLIAEFARRYSEKFALERLQLSEALITRMENAGWPGNVRQLENTVARFAALSNGSVVDVDAFEARAATPANPGETGSLADGPSLREQVDAFERNLIAHALASAGGNQSEAARKLGTSRITLIDKIKKHRLGR